MRKTDITDLSSDNDYDQLIDFISEVDPQALEDTESASVRADLRFGKEAATKTISAIEMAFAK